MRTFSGSLLRAQRTRCGLSASQLAARVGKSPWAVYDWEQGRAQPPIPVADAVADALGVTLDALLADNQTAARRRQAVAV
ncbi:helix-turn-helix transcriptional regulator [Streptomyces asoensis]|uniref:helix-turn-helix transcriptional regulator n=1 Tax=Streptomyces asoensis TaxID=249586 RepID=UPI0033D888A1